MRKIILLISFFALLSSSANSQTGWVQQNSGTFFDLVSVFFVDGNTGYVLGDTTNSTNNFILKTTNGGLNWSRQNVGSYSLYSIYFINANTGYTCGGGFGKTTNGGINWSIGLFTDPERMYSIYFINSSTGFQAGYLLVVPPPEPIVASCILRTTDGGNTWNRQTFSPEPSSLYSIYFPDSITGYACGDFSLKSTNSGLNWVQVGGYGNSIFFINNITGWTTGNYSYVYKTTNGGTNWISSYIGNTLYSVRFVNDQTGWVCGSNGGTIYGSTNGGANWILQSSGTTTYLYSLSFIDAQTGWAVGSFGRILKTTTGGLTFIQPISNEIPNEFKLYQNYPNPFNPTTKIKFQISKLSIAKIIIYDILGREVAKLVNEQLKPGSYEIEWNSSNYPSGVYFYKLTAGEYSETRKAVLIK